MDTKEFFAASSAELAEVLTERLSATPEPQPLAISEWLAMSLLQKAIRRGETAHALRAAATLLQRAPDRLWKRLTVAVFEDVGLGSLDLIAPVLTATSGKGVRRLFGGDWVVASAIVERMAAARKCRAADDLLMTVISHPRYEAERLSLTYRALRELMEIVCGDGDIITRGIALTFARGTDRFPVSSMRPRKGNLACVFGSMRRADFPFTVVDLAERGSTRFREPLPALMSLLSRDVPARCTGYEPTEKEDDFLPTTMIGDVPSWCVDFYTRPGRASLKAFLKQDTPSGRWIGEHITPRDRVEFLGGLVFRAQGGLLRRRLQWPMGERLRRTMEVEANGFGIEDASEVLTCCATTFRLWMRREQMFCENSLAVALQTTPAVEAGSGGHSIYNQMQSIALAPDARRTPNCPHLISGAQGVSHEVRALLTHSLADATRRAYGSDIAHYETWGGTIPSSPEQVAEYLAGLASTHTAATINRRLASLSKAHRAIGADDPTKSEIVKATMRGIRRMIGTAQREAKPILREDLFQMLERIGERPKDQRDKALLLLGFGGAFRRSELVGLDLADVENVRQGIVLTIRRSKTDQTGAGRKIGIPFGRTKWCPVKHLADWLETTGTTDGPIFRSINRHGHVDSQRLSGEAVSIIVKKRAEAAGFDPHAYSGHSLRAGLATSAVIAGVSTLSIRRTTGHASDAMLARYVRIGDIFTDNAAGAVL